MPPDILRHQSPDTQGPRPSTTAAGAAPDMMSWVRERLVTPRVLMLCALVVAGTALASPRAHGLDVVGTLGLAILLVGQFRLWDDLADRAWDSVHRPERVLARAADLRPFQSTLFASVVMAFALFWVANPVRALGYVALVAGFAVVYRSFGRTTPGRNARALLVSMKYAAFVLLLADWPLQPDAMAIAIAVYAVVCIEHGIAARRAARA